jgi:hypothetical protein
MIVAGKPVEMAAPVQHLACGTPDRRTVWVMRRDGAMGLGVFEETRSLGASQDWRGYFAQICCSLARICSQIVEHRRHEQDSQNNEYRNNILDIRSSNVR